MKKAVRKGSKRMKRVYEVRWGRGGRRRVKEQDMGKRCLVSKFVTLL